MFQRFAALGTAIMLTVGMPTAALADKGPKPTIAISYVISKGVKFDYRTASLLVTDSPSSVPGVMREIGPQRVERYEDHLWAMAYGFPRFFAIQIKLANGHVIRSNLFTKKAFDARYEAHISRTRITVQEK